MIPENQMEELLYDYHIAKAMGEALPYNENYKKVLYIEDVFQKHHTTEAAFDTSMVWYTRNTGILSKMYERINKRLKTELDDVKKMISIRDNKPIMSDAGDSVDVWFMEKIYRLTGYPLSNKISFNLPSDTNFFARDTLSWEVRYHFLGAEPDTTDAAIMAMHIIYQNDSIISEMKKIFRSGMDTIRLQADTLGNIKEIKGFIYYSGERDSTKSLWIDSISLMRYHSNDTLFANRVDTLNVVNRDAEAAPMPVNQIPAERSQEPTAQPAQRRIERPRATQRTEPVQQEDIVADPTR